MKILLLIALVAIAGVLLFYFLKKRSKRPQDSSVTEPPRDHSFSFTAPSGAPQNLSAKEIKPGWRVKHPELGNASCVVIGVVTFVEDGKYYWYELFVEQADKTLVWLAAEEDEAKANTWNYTLWEEIGRHSYELRSSKVSYNGLEYGLDESGKAKFTVQGRTNIGVESGTLKYKDYKSKDGARLFSIETYDGPGSDDASPEASAGVVINTAFLEISPPGL